MHKASRFEIDPTLVWALSAMSAALLIALAVTPMDVLGALPTFCPFKRFLGMECWGCGMTRALSASLHGKLQVAIAYNRGVVFTLPLLALFAVLPAGLARVGKRKHA